MGGVWTPSLWQPAVFLSLGLPDASSKRGLLGRLRSHVPSAAAGASPGLHLGDAEPGRELRQQQEPAAALMLEEMEATFTVTAECYSLPHGFSDPLWIPVLSPGG